MFKEKGGLRTRCPVVVGCEANQAHKTHLLGWLGKLETRIWQCFLEASQASLWAALQYFQTEWKSTGIQSPKQSTHQQRLVLASSSLAKRWHEVSEKSRKLGHSKASVREARCSSSSMYIREAQCRMCLLCGRGQCLKILLWLDGSVLPCSMMVSGLLSCLVKVH